MENEPYAHVEDSRDQSRWLVPLASMSHAFRIDPNLKVLAVWDSPKCDRCPYYFCGEHMMADAN